MRYYIISLWLVVLSAIFMLSCASNGNLRDSTKHELQESADLFYQAVLERDARSVYDRLSSNTQAQISFSEFKPYFEKNYDFFLDYATQLKYQIKSNSFSIYAIPVDAPCGELTMELDSQGNWIVPSAPTMDAIDSVSMRKEKVLRSLKSQEFVKALTEYSTHHPEFSMELFRRMRRELQYLDSNSIAFFFNHAIVHLNDEMIIELTCIRGSWSLTQCSY